MPLFI